MNILLLADEPSKSLWDFYDETKLKGIDLILSAGDLPARYLSFWLPFPTVRFCMCTGIMMTSMT